MGQRTTTLCDGCGAEQDKAEVTRRNDLRQTPRGWGTLNAMHPQTGYPSSYDLCAACVGKIVEHLGLEPLVEGYQVPEIDIAAPLKTCATCSQPYVGKGCYFCEEKPA